jgi:hypothetical protein
LKEALRLAEIRGAQSLTTDLGAGVPFEKGLRTCVVASVISDDLGLRRDDRQAVYFAALLRSLGCTAHASSFAEIFDDDVAIQRALKTLHPEDPGWEAGQTERFAAWAGRERARELTARFTELLAAEGQTRRWPREAVRSAPRSPPGWPCRRELSPRWTRSMSALTVADSPRAAAGTN